MGFLDLSELSRLLFEKIYCSESCDYWQLLSCQLATLTKIWKFLAGQKSTSFGQNLYIFGSSNFIFYSCIYLFRHK